MTRRVDLLVRTPPPAADTPSVNPFVIRAGACRARAQSAHLRLASWRRLLLSRLARDRGWLGLQP